MTDSERQALYPRPERRGFMAQSGKKGLRMRLLRCRAGLMAGVLFCAGEMREGLTRLNEKTREI
jgi:hypothetical protein